VCRGHSCTAGSYVERLGLSSIVYPEPRVTAPTPRLGFHSSPSLGIKFSSSPSLGPENSLGTESVPSLGRSLCAALRAERWDGNRLTLSHGPHGGCAVRAYDRHMCAPRCAHALAFDATASKGGDTDG
jgi:hypothetical protein